MTQPAGDLSIASGIPTQKVVQFGGIKGVIIGNESPLTVDITMQGTVQGGTLYPETIDFFPVRQGFNGNIIIKPRTLLGNPLSYVSSLLSFDVVGKNEKINLSAYPIALTRPAVSPTASGKGQGLFTATFGSINTASTVQALNIFNPLGSGLVYNFHSARIFTNDNTGTAAGNLILISGADLNLGTPVTITSHDGSSSARVSTAHATAEDTGAAHGGTLIETIAINTLVIQDFLAFPDNYTLFPGNNLRITIVSGGGTIGHVVRETLKWSEGQP